MGRTCHPDRLILAFAAATLLSACASVAPPPPTPGPVARLPEISESVINVHVSADYAALGAAASHAVPAKFVSVSAVDVGPLITFDLTGTRSDVILARAGDKLGFSTNVTVDGSVGLECDGCRSSLHVDGRVWGVAQPTRPMPIGCVYTTGVSPFFTGG